MHIRGKGSVTGAALVVGAVLLSGVGAGAVARAPASGWSNPVTVASVYDPYVKGMTACPQGTPNGGPKCGKLIPPSHPPA